MHTRTGIRTFTAAIVALALALPGGVLAGGDHYKGYGGDKDYRGGYHYGHSGKYYNKGHSGKYYNNRYHGGYYGGYSRKYVTKYSYDNDNDGENLLIGLLVGGLVGYAVGDARQDAVAGDYYPPASTAPREVYATTPYSYDEGEAGTCLQEREYQNKVIVGGKTVDAYGTACLQPDGSWRYGPPRLASF